MWKTDSNSFFTFAHEWKRETDCTFRLLSIENNDQVQPHHFAQLYKKFRSYSILLRWYAQTIFKYMIAKTRFCRFSVLYIYIYIYYISYSISWKWTCEATLVVCRIFSYRRNLSNPIKYPISRFLIESWTFSRFITNERLEWALCSVFRKKIASHKFNRSECIFAHLKRRRHEKGLCLFFFQSRPISEIWLRKIRIFQGHFSFAHAT